MLYSHNGVRIKHSGLNEPGRDEPAMAKSADPPEKKRKTSSKHSEEGPKAKVARSQQAASPGQDMVHTKPRMGGDKPKIAFSLDNPNYKIVPAVKKKVPKRKSPAKPKRQRSPNHQDETRAVANSLSEDDPNRLWCICRKPYDDKFMIQCDKCEEWFHGKCVNITKQKCKQFERENIEWFCPYCMGIIQKDAFSLENLSGKNSSGEPSAKKKFTQIKGKTKVDQSKKKFSTPFFSKKGGELGNGISKESSRKSTYNKQKAIEKGNQKLMKISKDNSTASKELNKSIDSDKFTLEKDAPQSLPQKPEKTVSSNFQKVKKIDYVSKKTAKKPRTQATTVKEKESSIHEIPDDQLPTYQQQRPLEQECIQCKKTKVKTDSLYCSERCIEIYVATTLSRKTSKVKNIIVLDRISGRKIVGFSEDKLLQWIKDNPTFEVVEKGSNISKLKIKKFKKKAESTSEANPELLPEHPDKEDTIRTNVRKSLKECLWARCQEADENFVESKIDEIACEVEEELYNNFRDVGLKYKAKYRSLIFNIKDIKNNGLFQKIVKSIISPDKLVRMSSDELASQELAQWRERETKHILEMIKKEQEDQISIPITKKTHKGEVEIKENRESKDVEETNEAPISASLDTTSKHRYHLFDQNCNICSGKIAPPYPDEVPVKRARVSPIAINDDQTKAHHPSRSYLKESQEEPQQLRSMKKKKKSMNPPRSPLKFLNYRSGSRIAWTGTIAMPGMAHFTTNAYQISGPPAKEILALEVPGTVTVQGKIAPEQVWDYISKIKVRGTNDMIILQLNPSASQEMEPYITFYKYLYKQKKYCMIENTSSMIKAFFLLPLASYSPIPTVLLPFEGPVCGLEGNHPPLFLGALVRKKMRVLDIGVQKTTDIKKESVPQLSYTPPHPKSSEKTLSSLQQPLIASTATYPSGSNAPKSLGPEMTVLTKTLPEKLDACSPTPAQLDSSQEVPVAKEEEDRWHSSPSPPPSYYQHHYRPHFRPHEPGWPPTAYFDPRRHHYRKHWHRYHLDRRKKYPHRQYNECKYAVS